MEKRMNYENYEEAGILNRLPVELRLEILCFLHVQTLLVLRAVNKWFRSVIDDSNFVSRHLRRLPSNLHETQFLIVGPGKWKFECSVDGLVLLVHHHPPNGSDYAVVWNPSLRTHCRYLLHMLSELKHYVLGYDASSNDYKLIVTTEFHQAWVYSVKSNAYSNVTSHSGYRRKQIDCVFCSKSLCFKDGVVWTENDKSLLKSNPNSLELVWFDFATERFRYADQMPYDGKSRTGLMTLDGGSTVGLWGVDAEDQAVASVWALLADAMSWAPRYKIPQEMVPFGVGVDILKVAERNGELVCKYWTREGSSIEVLSCRIQTQAIKRQRKISVQEGVCIGVLIESLFML